MKLAPVSWPRRPLGAWRTLLTAAEGYPALEQATLSARRSVWLWFRIFDPDMKLTDPHVRAEAGDCWADLLALKRDQGVFIAIALSDFDPLGASELHEGAWRAARRLAPLAGPGAFEVLVAPHPARAGSAWRAMLGLPAIWLTERRRRAFNTLDAALREIRFGDNPGLWPRLRIDAQARLRHRWPRWPEALPATHHQKVAVFDGARVILGGLDVDMRRWDDPGHNRPAEQTWRDVSVELDGPIAGDVARHLAGLWNDARLRFRNPAPQFAPPNATPLPRPGPIEAPPEADGADPDGPTVRFSRTLSGPSGERFRLSPLLVDNGLEREHIAAIAGARRLIYIETQYFRSRPIARALVAAARARPELDLILTIPAAPDNVAFEGASDPPTRFGEWLQARGLGAVLRAFAGRAFIASPARASARTESDRGSLQGAGIIYVHSKVLVADDAVAIVSSANLNGRSMRWDTEAGVVFDAPEAAAAIRRRLFETLLPQDAGPEAFAPETARAIWRRIAVANHAAPPEARRGLILPYDMTAPRRFGAPLPGAPEELV